MCLQCAELGEICRKVRRVIGRRREEDVEKEVGKFVGRRGEYLYEDVVRGGESCRKMWRKRWEDVEREVGKVVGRCGEYS